LKKIISNGPVAVKLTMEAAIHGSQMSLAEGLNLEATLFAVSCTTDDMREGTRAFVEKRPAKFTGK
jgi:enoyl-CoA hydratase